MGLKIGWGGSYFWWGGKVRSSIKSGVIPATKTTPLHAPGIQFIGIVLYRYSVTRNSCARHPVTRNSNFLTLLISK